MEFTRRAVHLLFMSISCLFLLDTLSRAEGILLSVDQRYIAGDTLQNKKYIKKEIVLF